MRVRTKFDSIGVLIRREETQKQRHKGECHVTTEAEIGVMCLQAKECQGLLAPSRTQEEARVDFLLEPSEGV